MSLPLRPLTANARKLVDELDEQHPNADWQAVAALMWRILFEHPALAVGDGVALMRGRGWIRLVADGGIPLNDGRRVGITDTGRAVAAEITP